MSESEVSDEQCSRVIDLPVGDYLYRREIQRLMNYDNGNAGKIRKIAADTWTKNFSREQIIFCNRRCNDNRHARVSGVDVKLISRGNFREF